MWKAEVLQLPFSYVTQPSRPEAVSETNTLPTTVNTATPAPQAAQPSAPTQGFLLSTPLHQTLASPVHDQIQVFQGASV